MAVVYRIANNSFHLKQSLPFFPPSINSRGRWHHSTSFATNAFIKDGALRINGREPLLGVPENIVVTPSSKGSLFLGAASPEARSRHVFKLGVVEDFRLLSLFRFKLWWMIPRIGRSGSDIPAETQFLLLEAMEYTDDGDGTSNADKGSVFYILFLPVLDGQFRSSLQGNSSNELEFCIESGRHQP